MSDRAYAKDPILVRSPKGIWIALLAGALLLFLIQVAGRFLAPSGSSKGKVVLNEDSGRQVFKEEDIARNLKSLVALPKEDYLSKLRMKNELSFAAGHESKRESLGPIVIVRREEVKTVQAMELASQPKPIGLPLGTKMPALLTGKIFSFNVENHVEAALVKDIYYLGVLRLPKGTKFFGHVNVLHSEDRVNIHFSRLLLPSGEEKNVRAVAHSMDGSGGIKGRVHRRWFNRFFTVTGKTALGAMTLFTVPNRQDAFSLDDQLRLTAASNLSQEAARELDRVKTDKAITVEGHIPIQIVLLESV